MQWSKPFRFERGALAAAVVLAHLVLVYLVIQARVRAPDMGDPEPVIAMLMDDPRDVRSGSPPVEIKAQLVDPSRGLVTKLPDIPLDEPDLPPVQTSENLKPIASPAVVPPSVSGAAFSGSDGEGHNSSSLAILQRTLPKYPATSVHLGEEGSSVVQIHVDEQGRVVEVKLARSSGFARLDESAVQAVRKWKFAPAMKGATPVSSWGEMELRFNLYRFTYSRIGEQAADRIPEEQVKTGATELATPGGEAALRRFIGDLNGGNLGAGQRDIAKIRAALNEWGAVKSVQFTGGVGDHGWGKYDVTPEFRGGQGRSTVEVRWDMYEVRHEHGTSEWRVAVDREGAVWCAQAGAAPWSR
jgi:protein TonB